MQLQHKKMTGVELIYRCG